jgi:uncharacterized protein (DUF1810 family)
VTSYQLERFVDAQRPVYSSVLEELRAGLKRTHWMWFVFPQLAGLGRSEMARSFAITSAGEALAYLSHPVLGARLRECTKFVLDIEGRSIHAIFGSPDDVKFRSSMTLFAHVTPSEALFRAALERYFEGEPDSLTLKLLESPRA